MILNPKISSFSVYALWVLEKEKKKKTDTGKEHISDDLKRTTTTTTTTTVLSTLKHHYTALTYPPLRIRRPMMKV
jgi:hypothetical protein